MLSPEERGRDCFVFVDNGFSGGNLDRDGYRRMMAEVEAGRIHKIIVYRLDRISRSLSDFLHILDLLKAHHVRFVSSQESFDTSSPYGEMIVKLLAVFAEFERNSIIERVTQAYAYRSELGLYMGGKRPYGFMLTEVRLHGIETKMYVPVPEEREVLASAFSAYALPGTTLRQVADHLPAGEGWSTAKLSSVLKNPIYVRADNEIYTYFLEKNIRVVSPASAFDGTHGIQLYGRSKGALKAVVMEHEGIVSSKVWLACQGKLAKNRKLGASLGNTTSWLGGLIHCGQCGRTMTVTKGGLHADGTRTRYFSCTGRTHLKCCPGPAVTLYAAALEEMMDEAVGERLSVLPPSRLPREDSRSGQINRIKNRISEIEGAEEKLVDQLLSEEAGEELAALLNGRAKKLGEEKKRLLCQLSVLDSGRGAADFPCSTDFCEAWRNAGYEERKTVTRLLVDSINISADGGVEVVWNG